MCVCVSACIDLQLLSAWIKELAFASMPAGLTPNASGQNAAKHTHGPRNSAGPMANLHLCREPDLSEGEVGVARFQFHCLNRFSESG